MQKTKVEYIGSDLDSMDLAVNYRKWIYALFSRYLGKNIIEVGSGTGAFSRQLLEGCPESLVLIEPSEMFDRLTAEIGIVQTNTDINFFNGTFVEYLAERDESKSPDTIVYINVLEHVEDDVAELERMREVLQDNGRICIFVPAVPSLLSDFDRMIGHFRRYSRRELVSKTERAGFKISFIRGFDFPGMLPWLIKYRLMGSRSMEPSMVRIYDRFCVPPIRMIENLLQPAIGKNLIMVAEKN